MDEMSLLRAVSLLLAERPPRSFQLMGEDLWLLSAAALREGLAAYDAELERTVPRELRGDFEREQTAVLTRAHGWLRRYNRTIHGRIRGYLSLGRACHFEYPWPVVAVLGICQVLRGVDRSRVYGLLGRLASRAGYTLLEEIAGGMGDVLLRTNRGIFADSIPTVLYSLRCHDLRTAGKSHLAEALLVGPLPALMDEESRSLCRTLYEALAIDDGEARFRRLADLTLVHFAREQAIFSYHMGPPPPARRRRSALVERLSRVSEVVAPAIEESRRGPRLVFRPYALPKGFAMADHETRVREFGRAFVTSVTRTLPEYRAALRYVLTRFGKKGEAGGARFAPGGTPPTTLG
jgi:hypothetical protein